MELKDAHIAITGGSRGIGEAAARALVAAGARVHLVARDADALRRLGGKLGCAWTAGDLLNEDFRSTLIETIEADGPLDVLVNNAGLERTGHVSEQTPDELRDVLRLNLEVPVLLCRDALRSMLPRRRGHIVNVSSMAMAVHNPGFATYGASKTGLSAFTGSLRQELRGSGVGLTIVEIGPVDTDMLADIRSNSAADQLFARYDKLRLNRTMPAAEVGDGIRNAIASDTWALRLPRRAGAFPAIANLTRRLGDLVQTGVPVD